MIQWIRNLQGQTKTPQSTLFRKTKTNSFKLDKFKFRKEIEYIQRRATKLIPTLKTLTYEERLGKINLPTLVYRRARGDMIETYNILTGIYDRNIGEDLLIIQEDTSTRGHTKNIYKRRSQLIEGNMLFVTGW